MHKKYLRFKKLLEAIASDTNFQEPGVSRVAGAALAKERRKLATLPSQRRGEIFRTRLPNQGRRS